MVDFQLLDKGCDDMKKTYNFNYENGKYIFRYTRPGSKEEPLIIDELKMELDTQKFYYIFFQDIDDAIDIVFENVMDRANIDSKILKRGDRIFSTVVELYNDIHKEILKKTGINDKGGNISDVNETSIE